MDESVPDTSSNKNLAQSFRRCRLSNLMPLTQLLGLMVTSTPENLSNCGKNRPETPCFQPGQGQLSMVDEGIQPFQWEAPTRGLRGTPYNRCQPFWLGSSLEPAEGTGILVRRGSQMAHQSPEVASNTAIPAAFWRSASRMPRFDQDRQHGGQSTHQ